MLPICRVYAIIYIDGERMKKEKLTRNIIKKDLQNEVMKKVMFFLVFFCPFIPTEGVQSLNFLKVR